MKDEVSTAATLVLIPNNADSAQEWMAAFADRESVNLVLEGDASANAAIGALVFEPSPGALDAYKHLRVVFNLGAGVDALLADEDLPDVPIVRLENADMSALMREYIVYQVIRIHRGFGWVEQQQANATWHAMPAASSASHCRVTVLGIGRLGAPTAQALRAVGYTVVGWSRTARSLPGIPCYVGRDSLDTLLATTDILVCTLPLTAETRGLLDLGLFSRLPMGASLVSVSRAGCLNESDLLLALDSGQLRHATLDCFRSEPLPSSHSFWMHPSVNVTPHLAASPQAAVCVDEILANVQHLLNDEPLRGVIDRGLGY